METERTSKDVAEHLVSITTKDGKTFDIERANGDVHIRSGDHSLTLHKATGRQTLDLISLLEEVGEIHTEEEDGHRSKS